MGEEFIQRQLDKNVPQIGKWDFYNIGSTTIKSLKAHGVISNVDYGKYEYKKVDSLIVLNKDVIAVVEFKDYAKLVNDKQISEAIEQELETAKAIGASIYIVTNAKKTIWINTMTGKRIKDRDNKPLSYPFDYTDKKLPELIKDILSSINEKNNQIKPIKLVNPTDLAKSIWQDVWAVSGATPENCLYTFVELFIFKYLSDLKVLRGLKSFGNLMNMYKSGETEDEVLEYYAARIRPYIKELFKEGKDGTTIINGTIFVSKDQKSIAGYSTVFHNILVKFEKYGELKNIDYDFKSKIFESFLKESISKKNWGQYFTPLKVVRAIVDMAKDDVKPGIKLCDPACGVGKFVLEPVFKRLESFFEIKNGNIIPKITIKGYDKGFEKDEQKTIILAKANMLIYFSELISQYPGLAGKFSEIFNETFTLKTNSILGTLSEPVSEEYDLILTNPPYVTSGCSNLRNEINKDGSSLSSYYENFGVGIESLFMQWIVKALKRGGKAFIIVPDGLLTRSNDIEMRRFIKKECYINGIISLPPKTFFTTPKKTYILSITKKDNPEDVQTDPFFTYIVSEIGESRDMYRFDIEQDDLKDAVKMFRGFMGSREYFMENNTNARCKIFPAEKLEDQSWAIEKWWTNEELKKIGISNSIDAIKFNEIPSLMETSANSIISMKEEMQELTDSIDENNIEYELVKMSDIFDFPPTNSNITKTFCNQNKGEIPVYGSSKTDISVLGYIKDNLPNVRYWENCLGWNRNGSVGYVFLHKEKFTSNEDHRVMTLKEEYIGYISLRYLKYIIEYTLLSQGFSFLDKCGVNKISKVSINIPIKNGTFDLEAQNLLADKYEKFESIKKELKKEMQILNDLRIKP